MRAVPLVGFWSDGQVSLSLKINHQNLKTALVNGRVLSEQGLIFVNRRGKMARVNIEECWWSDPRRTALARLVGDEVMANGLAVMMWRVAQEFWAKGELVPKHIWATVQANSKLIQANLAEERKDGIYVRGSSQYLDWVVERRKAAQAGGQKSAQRPRDSKGRLVKTSKQSPSKTQVTSKRIQASGSGSFSGSDSGSSKKRILSEFYASSDEAALEVVPESFPVPANKTKTQSIIATYCELFKTKYGSTAEINGKQAGMLGALVKSRSLEKATNLLENYFSLPDAYLVQRCHPVEMIHANMNRITVFRDTGRVITKAQAHEVDKNQAWAQDNSEAERKYREELKNVLGKDKKALVGGAQ